MRNEYGIGNSRLTCTSVYQLPVAMMNPPHVVVLLLLLASSVVMLHSSHHHDPKSKSSNERKHHDDNMHVILAANLINASEAVTIGRSLISCRLAIGMHA